MLENHMYLSHPIRICNSTSNANSNMYNSISHEYTLLHVHKCIETHVSSDVCLCITPVYTPVTAHARVCTGVHQTPLHTCGSSNPHYTVCTKGAAFMRETPALINMFLSICIFYIYKASVSLSSTPTFPL